MDVVCSMHEEMRNAHEIFVGILEVKDSSKDLDIG
jgi:hypothetical protein